VTHQSVGADATSSAVLHRRDWAVLGALAALAAVFCLYRLDARSIWLDEAVALRIARTKDMRALLSDGGNMAAYFLFLKGWLGLGDSEWVARFPSVAFSAVGGGLLYLLARRLFDFRVAVMAAALLVVNSSVIRYGQEARSYAFELMLVTAAWFVLSVALERRRVRWFVLWGLLTALAVASHIFAVFFVAAQLASLVLLPPRQRWKGLLAGLGVAAAGSAPVVFAAASTGSVHIGWIPPTSIFSFRQVLLFLGGNNFEPSQDWLPRLISVVVLATYTLGWVVGLGLAVRTGLRLGRSWKTWSYGVPVMWLIVPLAGATAVSATVQPLMVPRYFIALIPASCLLLALALSQLRRRAPLSVALGVLVLLGLVGVARSYGTGELGWRQAVTYLSEVARPGDAIVILPAHQRMPLDYYRERSPGVPLDYISPRPRAWRPAGASVFGVIEAFYEPSAPRQAAVLAAERPRFWVVTTDFTRWDASGRVVEAWARAGTFFRHLGPRFLVRSGRGFGTVGVLLMESNRGGSSGPAGIR
jgi:4-amino-4-deoxy-L-arabinose transferase-like glycosyltransferase